MFLKIACGTVKVQNPNEVLKMNAFIWWELEQKSKSGMRVLKRGDIVSSW